MFSTPWRHTLAVAALALAVAGPAAAQTYQLTAQVQSNATQFFPGPGVAVVNADNLNLLNQPAAAQLQRLDEESLAPNGGHATAGFLGQIGLLKAFATAAHPYCCALDGSTVTTGYADAFAQGTFFDTIAIGGAGLAAGTPVSYRVDFSISGTLSSPSFESGGFLSADGIAEVRLRDLTSFQEVSLRWDAKLNATGVYSLTLDTVVGHELGLSGMLYAGASVSSGARSGRSASADFYHSAGYTLAPSLAGLNTVGASGHDFLAPVPEPASALLAVAGLTLLIGLRRGRA